MTTRTPSSRDSSSSTTRSVCTMANADAREASRSSVVILDSEGLRQGGGGDASIFVAAEE
ncbi:MAG: hypothetical protein ACE5KX_04395 [Acidimicrobiia bacterium]